MLVIETLMRSRTFGLLLCDLWITAGLVEVVANTCEEGTTANGYDTVGHGCWVVVG